MPFLHCFVYCLHHTHRAPGGLFFPENILSHTLTLLFSSIWKCFLVELKTHSLKSPCPVSIWLRKFPIAISHWPCLFAIVVEVQHAAMQSSLNHCLTTQLNPYTNTTVQSRKTRERQTEEEGLKTWRIRSDILFSHCCQGVQRILLLCTALEEKYMGMQGMSSHPPHEIPCQSRSVLDCGHLPVNSAGHRFQRAHPIVLFLY